jgi:hypothetical protein
VQDWGELANITKLCHTTALEEVGYSMDNDPEDVEANTPEDAHKGDDGSESGLVELANHLDRIGLTKEADYLDALLRRKALFDGNRYATPSA